MERGEIHEDGDASVVGYHHVESDEVEYGS